MDIVNWQVLDEAAQEAVLTRPAQTNGAKVQAIVEDIIKNIKEKGDEALRTYSQTLDKYDGVLQVAQDEIKEASSKISPKLKAAIDAAYRNIYKFHAAQEPACVTLETYPGIICQSVTEPIEKVGLYVPGGSAPLVSTALMIAVPAQIAGCSEVVLCSPPPVGPAILYAASLCGVTKIFNIGGAHAVAAMAYGTQSVPKVQKIFGPGNQFVTMAKRLVSDDPRGAAIDMPAGPSEVLVIADDEANPAFVAADLLSQAEHGPDSQVMLLALSDSFVQKTLDEVEKFLQILPRASIARQALSHSHAILCKDLGEAAAISNAYAPEHLIVQVKDPKALAGSLRHAGSIFLGAYTTESLGDYAQGTNHTLPTYGYAKTASALGTADYRRRYTISQASPEGLKGLSEVVSTLADAEGLGAHKLAVTVRVDDLNNRS